MIERKKNKIDINKTKPNDLMAIVHYVKVKTSSPNEEKLIVNDLDDNSEFMITGKELIENSLSADQYKEEIKVNKTQAAELLVNSHNRPLTVAFLKTDDSERVLRGRLVQPEPLLGRSMVEDLDVKGSRLRQVDHRTIIYLIVDGVKYVVK